MYHVKSKKTWKSSVGLVVCFCALLVSIDCMAQGVGIRPAISSEQSDIGNLTIPFELPEQLYEGSYLEFPGSFARREFRYTPEGFILVYFYRTNGAARKDMKSYAEENHKISKEESSLLAKHFGCSQEQEEEQLITTWFTVSSYNIGIRVPRDKMGRRDLIKIGEEIILRYDERINRMFSTPKKCFETYLKAIDTQNTDLIIECMHNDGSEKAKSSLQYLKMTMPYLSMVRIASGVGEKKEDIEFGKVEIISDNEVKLPIVSDPKMTRESPAFLLLSAGMRGRRSKTGLWIPLRKAGGKWGIDLVTLQETAFARSRGMARRAECLSNLKQIGLGLHMHAMDHNEAFPEDIRVLYPTYISSAKIFKCPSDESISDIKEITRGTRISYVYVPGLTTKDGSDSIVAYDASPDFHGGEGRDVLFLDGHVKWYAEEEFQKLVNK